jgi:hypothetical protein
MHGIVGKALPRVGRHGYVSSYSGRHGTRPFMADRQASTGSMRAKGRAVAVARDAGRPAATLMIVAASSGLAALLLLLTSP